MIYSEIHDSCEELEVSFWSADYPDKGHIKNWSRKTKVEHSFSEEAEVTQIVVPMSIADLVDIELSKHSIIIYGD